MLLLKIPPVEGWDERKEEFCEAFEGATLQLEHSLISLAKWESIWHKPFLSMPSGNKPLKTVETTEEEFKSYVQCMVMTQNFNPKALDYLTQENKEQIKKYIEDPMTATWFTEDPRKHGRSSAGGTILTAELIYYFMIDCGIPKEMEKWHLNRLMTLIRVVKEKEKSNNRKQSRQDTMNNYAAMKARARRPK